MGEQTENKTPKLYCLDTDCQIEDCPYNIPVDLNVSTPVKVVHLEDNPMYCKKGNWYGYQVAGVDISKEE